MILICLINVLFPASPVPAEGYQDLWPGVRDRPHPENMAPDLTLINTAPSTTQIIYGRQTFISQNQHTVVFHKEILSYLARAVWIPGLRLASIALTPARLLCSLSAAPWRLRQDSRRTPSPSPRTGRLAQDTRTRKARPRQAGNQGVANLPGSTCIHGQQGNAGTANKRIYFWHKSRGGRGHMVARVTHSEAFKIHMCRLCAQRFYGDDLPLVVNSLVFCASL